MEEAREPSGLGGSLRAGLVGGVLAGFLFGQVDALVALLRGSPVSDPLAVVGCLAAAGVSYALFFSVVLIAAAVVLHPVLRRLPDLQRTARVFGLGLGLGIFCELYWWTRPFVFYGRPSTSPERLAAGALMAAVALVVGWRVAGPVLRGLGAQRRLLGLVLPLWMMLGVGFLLLDGQAGSDRGRINERNEDMPNVLLVVVDALRHDVLGCYGNEHVKTPVIDELAREGVVFENAFVQAPFTWTSFGSFLTGKYPRRHGLVKMKPGVRMRPNITLPWHLKSAKRLDGTQLDEKDYYGGTFMTGTLSQGSGLMRGFDVYFEALMGHELVHLDSRWSVFRSDLLLWIFKNKITQRLDSSLVVNTARDWLRKNEGRRFVAMVHLYSTHTPYDPEPEFREMYLDPDYTGPLNAFYADYRYAIEAGEYEPTPADVQRIKDLYYGGTSQADRDIGLVLDELRELGALDDTLVIVTSDHGEELGEHGVWEHNYMWQTNLQIPLVMSWPKGLPRGERVPALVDSIDVLPTVCDLLGIEVPNDPEDGERGRIDGASLMPLVDGEADSVRKYSFAENGRYVSVHDLERKLIVRRRALSPEGWAASISGEDEPPRFFDLKADPGELRNLVNSRREEAEELLEVLREWDASLPIPLSDIIESHRDLEAERLMNALGYTEGGVGWEDDEVEDEGGSDRERETGSKDE